MTPKGHGVIWGRRDLLYDPKGHGDLCGGFDLVYDPKVVFELWPFYLITLRIAFVSITKNEHDETTYFESMERRDCLIAL